jgi:hypothetical protein
MRREFYSGGAEGFYDPGNFYTFLRDLQGLDFASTVKKADGGICQCANYKATTIVYQTISSGPGLGAKVDLAGDEDAITKVISLIEGAKAHFDARKPSRE